MSWVENVVRKVVPYFISTTRGLDCEEHWTKSLFLKVAEAIELLVANHVVRTILGLNSQEKYHPHLSLMYSENIPIKERLKAAQSLDPTRLAYQFHITKLRLYKTEGGVEDWRKIAEIELSSS